MRKYNREIIYSIVAEYFFENRLRFQIKFAINNTQLMYLEYLHLNRIHLLLQHMNMFRKDFSVALINDLFDKGFLKRKVTSVDDPVEMSDKGTERMQKLYGGALDAKTFDEKMRKYVRFVSLSEVYATIKDSEDDLSEIPNHPPIKMIHSSVPKKEEEELELLREDPKWFERAEHIYKLYPRIINGRGMKGCAAMYDHELDKELTSKQDYLEAFLEKIDYDNELYIKIRKSLKKAVSEKSPIIAVTTFAKFVVNKVWEDLMDTEGFPNTDWSNDEDDNIGGYTII